MVSYVTTKFELGKGMKSYPLNIEHFSSLRGLYERSNYDTNSKSKYMVKYLFMYSNGPFNLIHLEIWLIVYINTI